MIGVLATAAAFAAPDRESLLSQWEQELRSQDGTESFEDLGGGVYRLQDSNLPYDGELRVLGVVIRSPDILGVTGDFTHMGMVEFELADLPPERLGSQGYYYWLADRQTLHYSESRGQWVGPAEYQAAIAGSYHDLASAPLSFMLNYGIWIPLVALIAFVFVLAGRQARKAKSLMDDGADINRKARENLDRSEKLQEQVLQIAREARDLQAETNRLLAEIAGTLRRPS